MAKAATKDNALDNVLDPSVIIYQAASYAGYSYAKSDKQT